MELVDRVAETVLYEGYLLWPYRRSALKNQQRWTFGGVFPHRYCQVSDSGDAGRMQTQILVRGDAGATVDVAIRFLHVVRRQALALEGGRLVERDEVVVGGSRYLSWEESAERRLERSGLTLSELAADPVRLEIEFPEDRHDESLEEDGSPAAVLRRTWEAIEGVAEISAQSLAPGLWRLTVSIDNTSDWAGTSRQEAVRRAMISTHTIIRGNQTEYVSSADPPAGLAGEVASCRNVGTWPVLIGRPGGVEAVLSSPIILSDFPEVAPESPGAMFDGGEIDQLLVLNILSLTDEEKREMADSDPRARAILERTQSLGRDELLPLYGRLAQGWNR